MPDTIVPKGTPTNYLSCTPYTLRLGRKFKFQSLGYKDYGVDRITVFAIIKEKREKWKENTKYAKDMGKMEEICPKDR